MKFSVYRKTRPTNISGRRDRLTVCIFSHFSHLGRARAEPATSVGTRLVLPKSKMSRVASPTQEEPGPSPEAEGLPGTTPRRVNSASESEATPSVNAKSFGAGDGDGAGAYTRPLFSST